jgi:hypothetical protein
LENARTATDFLKKVGKGNTGTGIQYMGIPVRIIMKIRYDGGQ